MVLIVIQCLSVPFNPKHKSIYTSLLGGQNNWKCSGPTKQSADSIDSCHLERLSYLSNEHCEYIFTFVPTLGIVSFVCISQYCTQVVCNVSNYAFFKSSKRHSVVLNWSACFPTKLLIPSALKQVINRCTLLIVYILLYIVSQVFFYLNSIRILLCYKIESFILWDGKKEATQLYLVIVLKHSSLMIDSYIFINTCARHQSYAGLLSPYSKILGIKGFFKPKIIFLNMYTICILFYQTQVLTHIRPHDRNLSFVIHHNSKLI